MNLLLALRARCCHINAKSSLHLTVQTQPLLDLWTQNREISNLFNLSRVGTDVFGQDPFLAYIYYLHIRQEIDSDLFFFLHKWLV